MVERTRSTKMTLYYTSPTNIQWIGLNFGELPYISVWKIITEIITSRNRYRKQPCKKLTFLCNQLQLVPHFLIDKQTLKHPELYTALYSTLLNPLKLYLILKPTNYIITLIANLCRVGIQKKQHIKEYRNIVK